MSMLRSIFTAPPSLVLAGVNKWSTLNRVHRGSELPEQEAKGRVYARNLEVPAGSGVGTARALARAYSEVTIGGGRLGLPRETLELLMAPPVPPAHGFRDECLKVEFRLSLGFAKPGPNHPFGHPSSFGAPGLGGSFAFADPHAQTGFAYVTNQMGTHFPDPRAEALRRAMYGSIGQPDPYNGQS